MHLNFCIWMALLDHKSKKPILPLLYHDNFSFLWGSHGIVLSLLCRNHFHPVSSIVFISSPFLCRTHQILMFLMPWNLYCRILLILVAVHSFTCIYIVVTCLLTVVNDLLLLNSIGDEVILHAAHDRSHALREQCAMCVAAVVFKYISKTYLCLFFIYSFVEKNKANNLLPLPQFSTSNFLSLVRIFQNIVDSFRY